MTERRHQPDVIALADFAVEDVERPRESLDPQAALNDLVSWARLDHPTYGWRRVLHRALGINLGPSKHELTIRRMVVSILDEIEATKEHQ